MIDQLSLLSETISMTQGEIAASINGANPFCEGKRMSNHTLVCPFLTDDPMFAYGVEFGLLYAHMQNGAGEIKDYFCRKNQDLILLLAGRLGWRVLKMKPWDKDWFFCEMEKGTAPTV